MYSITLEELAERLGDAGSVALQNKEQALDIAASAIAERMRLEAPVDTGLLVQSITIQSSGGTRIIGPNVPYADFVELGTKPHLIRAKPGGVLAFEIGGQKIFAKYVNHPGTKPNPFVKRALESYLSDLTKWIADVGVQAVVRGA